MIARSVTIKTPTDQMSPSEQFDYATIPLHLSFQKLIEGIQHALKSGDTLITALSRLQKEGKLFAFGSDALTNPSSGQHRILEALFGHNLLEEISSRTLSSQEVETRVRRHFAEILSSQAPVSSFAREQWSAAESSLFSAFTAFSSHGITSWGPAELSSWAAAVLSSWAVAGESSAGWRGEALSSWAPAGESSWGGSALASWFKGVESSWAQALLDASWLQSG